MPKKKIKKKVKKKAKAVETGICWINPNSINEMSDPHAKRYYTALKLFMAEQLKLMARWRLHGVTTIDGKDIVFITLPPDKDGGIFLKKARKKNKKTK